MVGDITLPAEYGRDSASGKMVMPLREALGLNGHQPMSPALEDRLCHLGITATSYERAAEVAKRFGIATDDSQIQRLVQRVGERAQVQSQKRVASAFTAGSRRRIVREAARDCPEGEFSMALMLDGTMLRSRGKDWGLKPASRPGERVAWHELKAGLVVRMPESSAIRRQRRPDSEKYYVATAGGPEDVGRALYAEALRRGLEQTKRVYVIADGAVWIWRVSEEHFPNANPEPFVAVGLSQSEAARLPSWFRGDGIGLFSVAGTIQAAGAILEQARRKKSTRLGTRMEKWRLGRNMENGRLTKMRCAPSQASS